MTVSGKAGLPEIGKPATAAEAFRATSAAKADGAGARAVGSGDRMLAVAERLFQEGFSFDFFQAVRLLEKLLPDRRAVGRAGPPRLEVVRFQAHLSLSFPPSAIYDLTEPTPATSIPAMTVTFMGLTGPSGVLPRHYTEILLRLDRELKGPEKNALRAWLDIFNHRLISLFFRAWEKYRFAIPYERGESDRPEPDPFTRALYSLIGLGLKPLQKRLCVSAREEVDGQKRDRVLAAIDDFSLFYYSGFLAHRPRCAVALEALLQDYFQLPIKVRQFHGQWLQLDVANQSRLGSAQANNQVGVNLVAGDRVWDVQNKIRVCVGPLNYEQFHELLPDRSPFPERKAFFLLAHLVRLYIGPELDFDVQLILRPEEVPGFLMAEINGPGPQLGWNTWVFSKPLKTAVGDAVFEGEEARWILPSERGGAVNTSAGPGNHLSDSV